MTITKNNKIIAEFLGRKGKVNTHLYTFKGIICNNDIWFSESDLRFHNDWNWLMAVVEKIESLGFWTRTQSTNNGSYLSFFIGKTGDEEPIIQYNRRKKIETTYTACLEFIKLHNINYK